MLESRSLLSHPSSAVRLSDCWSALSGHERTLLTVLLPLLAVEPHTLPGCIIGLDFLRLALATYRAPCGDTIAEWR